MAKRSGTVYVCQSCSFESSKWAGQCPNCHQWNTLVETVVSVRGNSKQQPRNGGHTGQVLKLSQVETSGRQTQRLNVGSAELTQVLGGGLVPGSVCLLAGEPGIGKSTLLSQLTLYFASKHGKVLYVCGEESAEQVKLRLERLSVHKKTSKEAKDLVLLLPEVDTDAIVSVMDQERPMLTIIDSIQTLSSGDLTGMAGSVGQVRESGNRIMRVAKNLELSTFLVGHVTKEGSIAGPKVLEHMVDTVLSLTGERSGSLRLLRAMKNRFGAVDEVGVFEMSDTGLVDVTNPSSLFLEEAQTGSPGSVLTVVMEGTRPMVVEVQALVVKSSLANPRRVSEGVRLSRLQVVCAVLQKQLGLKLYESDVYVNVTGGIAAHEPAVDLAVAMAIVSSTKEQPLPKSSVVVGEVGLLGEIRRVSFMDKRTKEAKKLGYDQMISSQDQKSVAKLVRILFKK